MKFRIRFRQKSTINPKWSPWTEVEPAKLVNWIGQEWNAVFQGIIKIMQTPQGPWVKDIGHPAVGHHLYPKWTIRYRSFYPARPEGGGQPNDLNVDFKWELFWDD